MQTSRSLGTHRAPRISAPPDASFARWPWLLAVQLRHATYAAPVAAEPQSGARIWAKRKQKGEARGLYADARFVATRASRSSESAFEETFGSLETRRVRRRRKIAEERLWRRIQLSRNGKWSCGVKPTDCYEGFAAVGRSQVAWGRPAASSGRTHAGALNVIIAALVAGRRTA